MILVCDRGCGTEKVWVFDVNERRVVSRPRTRYGDGYLLTSAHSGTGRLSADEAFIAALVRTGELG